MGKYYVTTEFLYRSTTEIQADSVGKAKEVWENLSIEKIVGKKNIDIGELEDGIVIAIDEEL
ncbi:MAG: hypothetical protein IJV33_02870 [Bacteroidaceae bacterium]|nr:hypothetical protein [Bacteroidaceae bacterium]